MSACQWSGRATPCPPWKALWLRVSWVRLGSEAPGSSPPRPRPRPRPSPRPRQGSGAGKAGPSSTRPSPRHQRHSRALPRNRGERGMAGRWPGFLTRPPQCATCAHARAHLLCGHQETCEWARKRPHATAPPTVGTHQPVSVRGGSWRSCQRGRDRGPGRPRASPGRAARERVTEQEAQGRAMPS